MALKMILANAALITAAAIQGPTAKTSYGDVVGNSLSTKVNAWVGIPFAQSPPERFSPPQDAKKWEKPLDATQSKPACIQQFQYPEESRNLTIKIFSSSMPEESEDCLYLNVWAPSSPPPKEGYPVLFWIYGGNLQFGHAALPMYSGERIAEKHNIVVVGANYRTNAFGFPGSPELAKGQNNLGFLDQRKALDWTSKNIAGFGGDPKKVTIFGESAGGFSTKQLVANPPSPLPFRAAIFQSQAASVRGGVESWEKLAKALKCEGNGQLACVRSKPAKEIKDILEKQRIDFGPQQDNVTHVTDVRENLKSGKAAKVPIILGTNRNEGTPFATIGLASPGATLDKFFSAFIPGGAEVANFVLNELKPLYPAAEFNTDIKLGSALFTDLGFTCSSSLLSQALAENGYDVHRYYYEGDFPEQHPFKDAGAYHSAEIELIFGTYKKTSVALEKLSESVQGYWTSFASNPAAPLSDWPKFTKESQQIQKFSNAKNSLVPASEIDKRCSTIGPFIEGLGV